VRSLCRVGPAYFDAFNCTDLPPVLFSKFANTTFAFQDPSGRVLLPPSSAPSSIFLQPSAQASVGAQLSFPDSGSCKAAAAQLDSDCAVLNACRASQLTFFSLPADRQCFVKLFESVLRSGGIQVYLGSGKWKRSSARHPRN
jgi:hypothetical protein